MLCVIRYVLEVLGGGARSVSVSIPCFLLARRARPHYVVDFVVIRHPSLPTVLADHSAKSLPTEPHYTITVCLAARQETRWSLVSSCEVCSW